MFRNLVMRCVVQRGRGGHLPLLCAGNRGGGDYLRCNTLSSTTHSIRSKRLGSKTVRIALPLSAANHKPFGDVTSVSGDVVNARRAQSSSIIFLNSFVSSSRNLLKGAWKHHRIRSQKFHKWMTAVRSVALTEGIVYSTSVSSIMGHMSFIMLAFGFMESDIVLLRSYAFGGIAASILFQYYRAQPLWLPISWNVLFLLINGAMITALIQERSEASHLEPEEAEVFSEVYDKVGVDPVEFLRVIRRAERRTISKGTVVAQAGKPQKKLYLIMNGAFKVYDPDGMTLGTIRSHQYIGSMAFLRFMYSSLAREEHCKGGLRALVAAHPPTSPEEEKKYKVKTTPPPYRPISDTLENAVIEAMESMEPDAGPLKNMVNSSDDSMPQKKETAEPVIPNFEKECITRSTVIAETTSDVYVWEFNDLEQFFHDHPKEQNAMSVSIGADLTNKIEQSRAVDINYHHLLDAALRFGEVLPLEKKKLQMFRKEHRISIEKHECMLKDLGWTKNDFDQGIKTKEVSRDFIRYSEILSSALKGDIVMDDAKLKLRFHRQELDIDSQEHLILLNNLGWTLDDYEAGFKYKSDKAVRV